MAPQYPTATSARHTSEPGGFGAPRHPGLFVGPQLTWEFLCLGFFTLSTYSQSTGIIYSGLYFHFHTQHGNSTLHTDVFFSGFLKTVKFHLERLPWNLALVMVCTWLTWPKKLSEKNV